LSADFEFARELFDQHDPIAARVKQMIKMRHDFLSWHEQRSSELVRLNLSVIYRKGRRSVSPIDHLFVDKYLALMRQRQMATFVCDGKSLPQQAV